MRFQNQLTRLLMFLIFAGCTQQSPTNGSLSGIQPLGLILPTPIAVYSVRVLVQGYTGPGFLVRNSLNGSQGQVFYDSLGNISPSSNLIITSAGSSAWTINQNMNFSDFYAGANVSVVTWYDQSGNSNDATQASSGNQASLMNSGNLQVMNSVPSLRFTAAGSNFYQTTNNVAISGASTANVVAQNISTGSNLAAIVTHFWNNNYIGLCIGHSSGTMYGGIWPGTWQTSRTTTDFPTQGFIATSIYGGSAITFYVNSTAQTPSLATSGASANYPVVIGRRWDLPDYFDGYISEIFISSSNLANSDRQTLESNQRTYFSTP